MKKTIALIFCLTLITFVSAQNVLILENQAIGKSYKFFIDDGIKVLTKGNPKKISGRIADILDTSIIISNGSVVDLGKISAVYVNRKGVQIISSVLMAFGVMYFTLDVVNNLLNNDYPTIRSDAGIIAGSSAAAGGLLWLFSERKCPVSKYKWKVKIIEMPHFKSK